MVFKKWLSGVGTFNFSEIEGRRLTMAKRP